MSAAETLAAQYRQHLGGDTSRVAAELELFANLLGKWNLAHNLVSRETVSQLWPRHIADSLQVLPHLRLEDRTLVDLGSGGGFPALPMAIALKGRPLNLLLLEPAAKKAAFLRTVIRELDLPAKVDARRAEAVASDHRGTADVVTSRALAPLKVLCELAYPFLGPQSRAIFHKGREHSEELKQTRSEWHLDVLTIPSATDEHGVLLELSGLSRRVSS